ncbi:putative nuclease HARBI1 [Macrosteles quadrilineatus]|uniref:putative nuclease HARBI1 n=1 Tax=Macrosteles quadrilineatus TaxID=74068 RepID=UPI0023E1A74A|nr:putative nuclease HARBI1 [Macrosteles quadrilineatus]
MTPLANPVTPAQVRYQRSIKSSRSIVERTFGVWKNRFRCIHTENTLRFSPQRCCTIIVACAVLHNFGIKKEQWQVDNEIAEEAGGEEGEVAAREDGVASRADLIQRHFS